MPTFFPRQTIELHLEEPRAFRQFSFSLVEMALVTGIVLRLYRVLVLAHQSNSWVYFGGVVTVGATVLLGMATAHLANYPLSQWLWRVPAFAAIEAAAESAMSALLIWAGREPTGTVRAAWADFPRIVSRTALYRGLTIVVWGLVLAAVVHLVRSRWIREDESPEELAS